MKSKIGLTLGRYGRILGHMRRISGELLEDLTRRALRAQVAQLFQVPERLLGQEPDMNTNFARETAAVLTFTLPGGAQQTIEFDQLNSLDYSPDLRDVADYGGFREVISSRQTATITIRGVVGKQTHTAAKKTKPEKAPKKPTLQASARAARKATVKHAQLTKRIFNAERALIELKNKKAATDTELKTAREAVLAAI